MAGDTFGIESPVGVVYYFLFDGRRLDNTKTLEQEGVLDGALVILGTEPQVGLGGCRGCQSSQN